VERPHHAAAVEFLADYEERGNALAIAMRRRGLDELDRADASIAMRDFGPPFPDEQLGDARRDASQVLAVGLLKIDAWLEGAGLRRTPSARASRQTSAADHRRAWREKVP
jgi:hypothetical protein